MDGGGWVEADQYKAEVTRLRKLLQLVNEWRHTDEVESSFTLVSIHSYAPTISEEFEQKYYPMLEQLDKEFPVKEKD